MHTVEFKDGWSPRGTRMRQVRPALSEQERWSVGVDYDAYRADGDLWGGTHDGRIAHDWIPCACGYAVCAKTGPCAPPPPVPPAPPMVYDGFNSNDYNPHRWCAGDAIALIESGVLAGGYMITRIDPIRYVFHLNHRPELSISEAKGRWRRVFRKR